MRYHILSIFPGMFAGPFDDSLIRKAQEKGLVRISIYNIRDYTHDRHHTVDDYLFGGGAGMVMKPEPLFEAVESIRSSTSIDDPPIILLYGGADKGVIQPVHGERMKKLCDKVGVESHFQVIPGAGHGGPGYRDAERKKLILGVLGRALRGAK